MVRSFDVRLKVAFLREGELAVGAAVWLLAAVFLQVHLQSVLLVECLLADVAHERPFA